MAARINPQHDELTRLKIHLKGASLRGRCGQLRSFRWFGTSGPDLAPAHPRRPRAADLPKGEIWAPDQGLHPIPDSWKEEVRRGYPTSGSAPGEVIRRPVRPSKRD